MKLTICALLLVLQVSLVSARSGLRDECRFRPSVRCNGEVHKMSEEDCEMGHEYIYCARDAVKDELTGVWSLKIGTYSSRGPIDKLKCAVSETETRVVIPNGRNDELYVSDILEICGKKEEAKKHNIIIQSKRTKKLLDSEESTSFDSTDIEERTKKISPVEKDEGELRKIKGSSSITARNSEKSISSIEMEEMEMDKLLAERRAIKREKKAQRKSREKSIPSIEFAEAERDIYLSDRHLNQKYDELKKHIDDLYSLTSQTRQFSIVLFIILLFVGVFLYRQSQKSRLPLSSDQRPLVLDYDEKAYKPSTV